ncbi:ATP-binding cassette domain-containing protein [Vagococcus sp. BWB3-3]|uniref:ATP-binding cassette domain-containing protein n=1 Tax=Vagococcus allomyrinae TaxID=2794353 RepID=A0A940P537_9ENTE|nr:ATP-binding cassette domain-containing protein [Vagococcus allomyrinae]MBP1039901.1 ATP-binding cassette domain-containing protein [Vagococcus allomyrinae]
MIQFKNVSKTYGQGKYQPKALAAISLEIATEERFGIVGASGSGKSTLLRLINQLETPDTGHILLKGENISCLSTKEQRLNRQKIGMIFQQFHLLNNKTVYENVALPLKLQGKNKQPRVREMMDFVNISNLAHQSPQQLSGGQKQRVAIARALSYDPQILLCDEPTSALDDQHTEEIIQLLKKVHQHFRTTMLIVSHDFSVIRQLCTRAAILEDGHLLDVIQVAPAAKAAIFESYYHRALESLSR